MLATLAVATLAGATVPLGEQFRISQVGTDGDATRGANGRPAAAFDPERQRYLVVWPGDPVTDNDTEVWGRLVNADATIAGDAFRVSDAGPAGTPLYPAQEPAVAYNATRDEFLLAWVGTETYSAVKQNEIFVQRLNSSGQEIGSDDQRISTMGPDDASGYGVSRPSIAYNPIADEYMVVWDGEDDRGDMVLGENEVFAQRLNGAGEEIGADDMRISDVGPPGATTHSAYDAAVAFEPGTQRYMVTFAGDETDNAYEILVQRLAADGAEIGINDQRVSTMGANDADPFFPGNTNVAVNPLDHEFLVAWESDDDTGGMVSGEFEVFVQRVSADGAEVGPDDLRISEAGPAGDPSFAAGNRPGVAFSPLDREWIVTWDGDDTGTDQDFEVFLQRLSAEAAEVGADDQQISQMGPVGVPAYQAGSAMATHDNVHNEYLVVWTGDTDAGDLVDNEYEVWARRFDGVATPDPGPGASPTPDPGGNQAPLDTVAPALDDLALSPTRFRAFTSGESIRSAAKRGSRVYYTLGEAATTTFAVRRARPGRRVKGRCVAPKRSNRRRKRCTRYVAVPGSFAHAGISGANTFSFSGRIGGRRLRPGRYRLLAVARDAAGNPSSTARAGFRITRR